MECERRQAVLGGFSLADGVMDRCSWGMWKWSRVEVMDGSHVVGFGFGMLGSLE